MKYLDDYLMLNKALDRIEIIKKNPNKDKKYWTCFQRDYSSDFGLFHVSYYEGDYGSSSVSNVLPSKISEETKAEFKRFIDSKLEKIITEFVEHLRNKSKEEAKEALIKLEKKKQELSIIFDEESE